ncbi:heme utilization protein [Pseudomonas sp. D2002]|uniref:heme utilization protein n=1 Tax=Pseudomonas sp. D2002 TaxID=2726980 RepID=UPI0015A04E35|nr:heme utilization protein [Pseudomonas sp. D2002]NWA81433.1 heme utilization protein [Pseudomonas sp. D2002]
MKTTMALKPLAFALAALMAVAAQAGQPNHHPQPAPTTASATTLDGQSNHSNVVINDKTKNNASANDSYNHISGVANGNVLSGDNNQGKNDVAIVSGDADFVFASAGTAQSNTGNFVLNSGTKNNASLNDSGNHASGIIQLNAASGTSNQASNSTAIASGNGDGGAAAVTGVQDVSGNLTLNLSSGHGWSTKPVVNNASVNNSMNYSSGVSNSNVLSGSNNQGQNNVAITRF